GAAEWLADCFEGSTDGVGSWHRLEPHPLPRGLVQHRPEGSRQENSWIALPVGPGKALDVNRQQAGMTPEGRHEPGLKEGRFAGARLPFEEDQGFLAAQSGQLVDVLAATEQMRRVGALEAQCFRAQQDRAAPAGELKQPPADPDERQRRDAELPLVETGEDAEAVP